MLVRTPVIGPTILSGLKKKNRISSVRQFAAGLKDLPLYYPLPDHSDHVEERENQLASSFDLDSFAQQDHTFHLTDPSSGFRHWTIRDYTSRFETGEITPLQVAKAIIQAVNHSNGLNPPLKAVVVMNTDDLLQQARESTERYKTKTTKGVLDGVPVAVKDEVINP